MAWASSWETSAFANPDEGRVNSRNQAFSPMQVALNPSLEPWKSLQPNFTRKDERRDGSIHTLSRVDRMFIILPVAELRDIRCHASTVGSSGVWSVPSDHITVRLAIQCSRVIRRWLTQHPLFVSAHGEIQQDVTNDEDPFVALNQFREVAFSASTKARQAILTNTPTTLRAKFLDACTALRAYRNGLNGTIRH